MIKVGINGFGRIGRFVFRAAQKRNDIQIVGINDLCPVDYLAYMLKYDTVHGRFDGTVEVKDGMLVVNGFAVRVSSEKNPADIKWGDYNNYDLCINSAFLGIDGTTKLIEEIINIKKK